jgi:oligopeptide transport system substrate-binding protein
MVLKSAMTRGAAAALFLVAAVLYASGVRAEQKSQDQRALSQEVYFSAGDEPPSMDPTKQADTISSMWLGHIFEGLMSYDPAGNIIPGTAESMTSSEDKKTWTFKIRKSARWQDGKPVKAQDFLYSWRRLVDPAYASEYSFIAIAAGILNAEDIISKKQPKENLGVRAVDDHTLEVQLSRPVPFFDSLATFQVFYPLRRDIVEKFGDKFATDPASIIGNGPFKLAAWQKEQSMRIERSPTYWDADKVRIQAIQSPAMVKDSQANFNNFQTGGIDYTTTSSPEIIKQAQAAKLKIQTFPTGCTTYIAFNVRPGRPFANKLLRQAVRDGVNRSEFVNKIIGVPGYKPTLGLVPDYMPGSKKGMTYRREAPVKGRDADYPSSQKHLQEYLAVSKQTQAPSFTILSDDGTLAKKFVEYWQNSLAKLLNTEVRVESVPFKTRLQKSRDGNYDVTLSGWCPDYRDPMTFMDLFTAGNDNNMTGWVNKTYEALIVKAANESDIAARIKLFAEAEALLLDESPMVPLDQTGGAFVVAPALKNMRHNAFGFSPDFRYAVWDSQPKH